MARGRKAGSGKPIAENFAKHVVVNVHNGCHVWTGTLSWKGYGQFSLAKTHPEKIRLGLRSNYAHRVRMSMHLNRALRSDEVVMHLCNNRACVNIEHLKLGTTAENNEYSFACGHRERAKLKAPGPGTPKGEKHSKSKVSTADVLRIRELSAAGVDHAVLAQKYGYTRPGINAIVKRICWKHV